MSLRTGGIESGFGGMKVSLATSDVDACDQDKNRNQDCTRRQDAKTPRGKGKRDEGTEGRRESRPTGSFTSSLRPFVPLSLSPASWRLGPSAHFWIAECQTEWRDKSRPTKIPPAPFSPSPLYSGRGLGEGLLC